MTMNIPMCWKCRSKIAKPKDDGSFTLVGCKENKDIHNYDDAMDSCPLCPATKKD